MKTSLSRTLAAALISIGGCVNRPRVEASPESEQVDELDAGKPELKWRELADRRPNFEPPKPLGDLGPPLTELPAISHSPPSGAFNDLPRSQAGSDPCYIQRSAFCAHSKFDADGHLVWENRIEHGDDPASVIISMEPTSHWQVGRCWRDAQGRIVRAEEQWTRRSTGGCQGWAIRTTRDGYDEHGQIVLAESINERFVPPERNRDLESEEDYVDVVKDPSEYVQVGESSDRDVFQIVYKDGRPVRETTYKVSDDFRTPSMSRTCNYEWADERLARYDCFDSGREWAESKLYTWSDDFLRIDSFKPHTEDPAGGFGWLSPPAEGVATNHMTEIHQRRGSGDYVQVYESPNIHWEYSTENGIEAASKFVGEQVVERRRFALVEGERRPLTVEQYVPEELGLLTIEQWDWSSDGVVVDKQDGSEVYLLDCSELPPIDELIDPDCPPPRPIR